MQSYIKHQQFNSMPKSAGVSASNWQAIEYVGQSYDRTPESFISSGLVREGWDG